MPKRIPSTLFTHGMFTFNKLYTCKSLISIHGQSDGLHFSHWAAAAALAKAYHSFYPPCGSAFPFRLRSTMDTSRSIGINNTNVFRLSDYDCIGFDLDNTICRYKLTSMVKLEYDILAKYLVSTKGHNPDYLLKPFEDDIDFIKKGLLLDFVRGNVVQINCNGYIVKASHGTRFLDNDEIEKAYGFERKWCVAEEFTRNMLEAWNGPLSEKVRTLLDYFDMPASLVFARIVDSLDAKEGKVLDTYSVWPDVLDALIYMYQRENFTEDGGDYFPALKNNPELYINKCSEDVLNWLKLIKNSKTVFLITGSHIDFANFTATQSMGAEWRSLFDVVICYARKPGFFTGARPFIKLDGFNETDPINGDDLQIGNIYSQGNWQDLYQLLKKTTGKMNPKCVYFGDNLIQDIYTPSEYTKCDTVSVVEELSAEGMVGSIQFHTDSPVLVSNSWGSYFCCSLETDPKYTLWGEIIRKHSRICVPNLDCLANHALDYGFSPFMIDNMDQCKQMGYYPNCPLRIVPTIKNQLQKMRRPMERQSSQPTFRMKRLMKQQSETLQLMQTMQEEKTRKENV